MDRFLCLWWHCDLPQTETRNVNLTDINANRLLQILRIFFRITSLESLEGFGRIECCKVERYTLVFSSSGPFSSWQTFMFCAVFCVYKGGAQARRHKGWRYQHSGTFECLKCDSWDKTSGPNCSISRNINMKVGQNIRPMDFRVSVSLLSWGSSRRTLTFWESNLSYDNGLTRPKGTRRTPSRVVVWISCRIGVYSNPLYITYTGLKENNAYSQTL